MLNNLSFSIKDMLNRQISTRHQVYLTPITREVMWLWILPKIRFIFHFFRWEGYELRESTLNKCPVAKFVGQFPTKLKKMECQELMVLENYWELGGGILHIFWSHALVLKSEVFLCKSNFFLHRTYLYREPSILGIPFFSIFRKLTYELRDWTLINKSAAHFLYI